MQVTAQAGDRENWAAARTRHLANHPPEKEINQLKKALNPPQRENPVSPTYVPLQWCHDA